VKAIKPLRLGLLTRVFEYDRRYHLAVTGCLFVRLGERPSVLTEPELWRFLAEKLGRDAAFDEAMPKARAEYLLAGSAYAPGGSAAAVDVRAQVGPLQKHVRVVGDRRWIAGAMSAPEPFTSLPLHWSRAYGGEGEPRNPVGRGRNPVSTDAGMVHPLPNLEDPRRPVRSPGDRPEPVGFGALDFSWPQRFSRIGTYDAAWLKDQFPGLARDIDWNFFNVAPEDQRADAWWRGDESYAFEGMHPEHPVLRGSLPGLTVRAFVTVGDRPWAELGMRLDTLHFFPEAERVAMVFRGVTLVDTDDGHDLHDVMLACERIGEPRALEHYAHVRANRLDETHAPKFVLREQDLVPAELLDAPPDPVVSALSSLATPENLRARNMERRAHRERDKMEAKVREAGLDPALFVRPVEPAPGPAPDPNDIGALMEYAEREGARAREAAEAHRVTAVAQARAACTEAGVDFDALQAAVAQHNAGPPRFRARDELARLRGELERAAAQGADVTAMRALLDDPTVESRLVVAEQALLNAYRNHAHRMHPAARAPEEASLWWRDRIAEAILAGQRIDGTDLTGADLSGMDLRGGSFRDCYMEGCNLEGSDLSRVDLTGAVLARARLRGANLQGARLQGANLGGADLADADFTGADLIRACLATASMPRTRFHRADLLKADLLEATFGETDFREARLREAIFLQVDLTGCSFAGADLTQAVFLECRLDRADLSQCRAEHAALVKTSARQVNLRGATINHLRVVHGSDLTGADLQQCKARQANLRGTPMTGAKLSKSDFDGADLSECDLRDGQLYLTTLRGGMAVRTDFTDAMMVSFNGMNAILQKAVIQGADLTGANLFRADLALVRGRAKSLTDALLEQARVVQRGEP
jgi:uncharacterized protein YjbI with pentapeptide repeats